MLRQGARDIRGQTPHAVGFLRVLLLGFRGLGFRGLGFSCLGVRFRG